MLVVNICLSLKSGLFILNELVKEVLLILAISLKLPPFEVAKEFVKLNFKRLKLLIDFEIYICIWKII